MQTLTERDLSKQEQELGNEEVALASELGSLKALAADLDARARQARQLADEVAVKGEREVSTRLRGLSVPTVNEAALERARQARAEAIRVRREESARARQALAATRRQLAELSSQLESSEHEARETLSRLTQVERLRAVAEPPPAAPPSEGFAGATAVGAHQSLEQVLTATVLAARPSQRRTQQRVSVQTSVDLQTETNFYMAFSADISEGGLFVATVMVQPLGTEIDVDLTLPSGERVQASGVVRWVREASDFQPETYPGMGIQFSHIAAETQECIRRFVAQRDPMFYVD